MTTSHDWAPTTGTHAVFKCRKCKAVGFAPHPLPREGCPGVEAATVEPQQSYGLVMPFVCCQSEGGPYEDRAFVAGVRLGTTDAMLGNLRPARHSMLVEPELVDQFDLLAMKNGYRMNVDRASSVSEGWVAVEFIRASGVAE